MYLASNLSHTYRNAGSKTQLSMLKLTKKGSVLNTTAVASMSTVLAWASHEQTSNSPSDGSNVMVELYTLNVFTHCNHSEMVLNGKGKTHKNHALEVFKLISTTFLFLSQHKVNTSLTSVTSITFAAESFVPPNIKMSRISDCYEEHISLH